MDAAARKSCIFWVIFIVAAVLAAYSPVRHAGWIWDDDKHITNNIHLRTLHGLRELWLRPGAVPQYYPLTHTTFWIEYHLWGDNPLGYHVDNVLLHLANAIMIGLILRRLNVPGATLAAAIFALHPVEVESAAWVTERKNVLSTFFYLMAMWVALDVWGIATNEKAHRTGSQGIRYTLCLGLFILALLSKTVTASLPVAILLLIWWKSKRITMRQFASLIPFMALGAAFGWHTSWMERHVVGAVGPDWSWTFPQRILIASHAVWFYLGKLVWPHPLIFFYPKWSPGSPVQCLYPIVLMALIAILAWKNRTILIVLLFFIVTLFPALGFANVYPMRFSFVADHFQYLASIGPIALAAALIRKPIFGLPIVIVLGLLTWQLAHVYADAETLWRDVIAKNPQSAVAHNDLASEYYKHGDLDAEKTELEKALQIDPLYVEARVALAGIAEARGDSNQAEQILRQAAADAPQSPFPSWNLGLWDRNHDRPDDAKIQFTEAAKHLPNPAPAYEQLGEIALKAGDRTEAETQTKRALSYDPDLVQAHVNLAAMYLNDPPAAQHEAEIALSIDPNHASAWNILGIVAANNRQFDQAIADFKKALECDPDFSTARENLEKLGQH